MEPKEEVVPFIGIVKEGFAKEVTFKMDLEKTNMGSQDGGWGSERKAHPDRGNDRYQVLGASLVAQMVKHLPTMRKTRVRSLGWEVPLEKEMATHSSILAWKIPIDGRSPVGYSPWDCKELDTTEGLNSLQVAEVTTFRIYQRRSRI